MAKLDAVLSSSVTVPGLAWHCSLLLLLVPFLVTCKWGYMLGGKGLQLTVHDLMGESATRTCSHADLSARSLCRNECRVSTCDFADSCSCVIFACAVIQSRGPCVHSPRHSQARTPSDEKLHVSSACRRRTPHTRGTSASAWTRAMRMQGRPSAREPSWQTSGRCLSAPCPPMRL